jgi:energy-coupling factor transporter transmembrane protein EcfT
MDKISINKKYSGTIILSVILVFLAIFTKDLFFLVILLYGLFIKLLLSEFITGKLRKVTSGVIWGSFTIFFCLGFYVNYQLPHGPKYPTGEVVCQNDERGPCTEEYKEDMGNLNIPEWAKFIRSSSGMIVIIGLLFAGIASGAKVEGYYE